MSTRDNNIIILNVTIMTFLELEVPDSKLVAELIKKFKRQSDRD